MDGEDDGEKEEDKEREQSRERGGQREGKAQGCTDRMVRLGEPVSLPEGQLEGAGAGGAQPVPATCRFFCFGVIGSFAEN